ncbi:M12 family metallo-peptidase [bacterium]|nr:M12 family metallo-peptidase [bacterium]
MFKGILFYSLTFATLLKAEDFIIPSDVYGFNTFDDTSNCRSTEMAQATVLFVQDSQFTNLGKQSSDWIKSVNHYYDNSKVYLELRKVGLVDYRFRGKTMRDKLKELRNSPSVSRYRNQYEADFVIGIVDKTAKDGIVGMGFINIGEKFAYSVVRKSAGAVTIAHELGHNMGLGHSVIQGSEGSPFSWGRGHGVKGRFATIMAYAHVYPAPRVHVFSNPKIRCDGLRCGVGGDHRESANSARALNCVRFYISKHR